MPFLIDGHNLIPQVGLSLRAIDDEMELIEILQDYCRLSRKNVEVFFDGGQPGQPTVRKFGRVMATFVRTGSTADAAIITRLRKLGKAARNWTVVSSDRAVQRAARSASARVLGSDEFAQIIFTLADGKQADEKEPPGLLPEELGQWLELFDSQKKRKN